MSLRDYFDACYAQIIHEEMAAEGYTVTGAKAIVDERLLPPEEQAVLAAERQQRENLEAALGLGLPIMGLPGA